jgi:hypothetical protein
MSESESNESRMTEKLPKSTTHPSGDTRRTEAAHVLQPSAAHGEIAHEVPDQGRELENGRNESEEEVLELK